MPHHRARFGCLRLGGPPEELEAAVAAAWESGASGLEERGDPSGSDTWGDPSGSDTWGDPSGSDAWGDSSGPEAPGESSVRELIVYASSEAIARVESSLRRWATRHAPGVVVSAVEAVPDVDWMARYREHQRVIEVSPRLRVRPPWIPGSSRDIVIEARQAFGTGAHASTALALEGVDRALAERPAARVLDVGCGSGVLAIAALRCGAGRVYACDIDPRAAAETVENARDNGVGDAVTVWCGSLEASALQEIELGVANLVRRELLPLLSPLCDRLAPAAPLWLSGLLAADVAEVERALAARGYVVRSRLERNEGGDHWVALGAARHPAAGTA